MPGIPEYYRKERMAGAIGVAIPDKAAAQSVGRASEQLGKAVLETSAKIWDDYYTSQAVDQINTAKSEAYKRMDEYWRWQLTNPNPEAYKDEFDKTKTKIENEVFSEITNSIAKERMESWAVPQFARWEHNSLLRMRSVALSQQKARLETNISNMIESAVNAPNEAEYVKQMSTLQATCYEAAGVGLKDGEDNEYPFLLISPEEADGLWTQAKQEIETRRLSNSLFAELSVLPEEESLKELAGLNILDDVKNDVEDNLKDFYAAGKLGLKKVQKAERESIYGKINKGDTANLSNYIKSLPNLDEEEKTNIVDKWEKRNDAILDDKNDPFEKTQNPEKYWEMESKIRKDPDSVSYDEIDALVGKDISVGDGGVLYDYKERKAGPLKGPVQDLYFERLINVAKKSKDIKAFDYIEKNQNLRDFFINNPDANIRKTEEFWQAEIYPVVKSTLEKFLEGPWWPEKGSGIWAEGPRRRKKREENKVLTTEIARQYLDMARNDRALAERMAKDDGYTW